MFYFKNKFIKIMQNVFYNGWIDKKTYLMIINVYKYNGILTCELCKEPINNNNDNRKMSIDHIIPKALGGNGNLDNLRIAHRKCNNERIK